MRIVDVLVNEWIDKHLASAELHKEMPRHIVGQIGHDDCAPPSLINSATVDLQEVETSVDVHLALVMINNARGGQDLTVSLREVEQSFQPVDVGALHEVGRVQGHLEPLGHGHLFVTEDTFVAFLVNSHMHVERRRTEVEHDRLLWEAETTKSSCDHILDVVVQGLLDIDRRRVDKHCMLSNLGECHDSFLEFEVAPPLLDPVGCSALDDHVDWVLLERATEEGCSDVLLDHGDVRSTVEQRLKEAQELLVLICVHSPVVVEDGEQD